MSTTTTSSSSSVEEDVMRIKKRLEKMMKAKEIDVNISIDMLNTLKKLPIDLQILTTTGIGVVLNSLRKSCDSEDLGTLAKTVLKNWRKLVASETPGNTNVSSPNSNSNDSSTKQPVSPVTTPANTSNGSNGSLKRTLSDSPTDNQAVPSKQANHHTDNNNSSSNNSSSTKSDSTVNVSKPIVNGINRSSSATSSTNGNIGRDAKRFNRSQSYTETKDPTRQKCREMLANALEIPEPNEFKSEMIDAVELAARCEDAIFNEFKSTDMKYKNKIRSRVLNLKDAKNPKLRENVRLGYISPEKFASMTAEEMASDELKNLRAQLTKEAINDHQMARTQGAKTSLLKCGKCKSNNIVYSEMQTRSADEPMTTFAFCQDCGHRWKFC